MLLLLRPYGAQAAVALLCLPVFFLLSEWLDGWDDFSCCDQPSNFVSCQVSICKAWTKTWEIAALAFGKAGLLDVYSNLAQSLIIQAGLRHSRTSKFRSQDRTCFDLKPCEHTLRLIQTIHQLVRGPVHAHLFLKSQCGHEGAVW